jgi:arginyl-tRNA synthetase
MFQLYVRVSALEEADASVAQDCRLLASKLAQNDSETIAIWRKMVDASIHCLGQQMKLLDIVPTYNI